nr:UDP-glycosyltranserase [Gynostemma pentaphyllum]
MKKFELVFIPGMGMGHLGSTVEMAKLLVDRDDRLSVTVLVIKLPLDTKTSDQIESLSSSLAHKSIRFITLPEQPLPEVSDKFFQLTTIMEINKSPVREAVMKIKDSQRGPDSPILAGFIIDMFCTAMIDVAKEFDLPCYVFYTTNAGFLSLSFHLQNLYDQNNNNDEVNQTVNFPGFVNPIPGNNIPTILHDKDSAAFFYDIARKFRSQIDGILINTFSELESHVMDEISSGFTSKLPSLYAVGPVLNNVAGSGGAHGGADILKWLDDQPPSSVLFLCFGSMGSFDEDQVKEIAFALERSGVRFLWSLRRPTPEGLFEVPSEYVDMKDVLPNGFLDRTAGIGKVIGWAPQLEVLAHPATGGFISHCGWNSILESVWHGVPVATWPMYAEQKFNAFEMVVELGLAVEITLNYEKDIRTGKARIVSEEEIENGIRKLMKEGDHDIRKKVKAKSEESRKSLAEGGSSFTSLGRFIDDVLAKLPINNPTST